MSNIRFYEISPAADRDLEEIYDYVKDRFSTDHAEEYLLDLEILFDLLVQNPEMGRQRDEVRPGLRSFPKNQHIVFYRLSPDRVRIVRVLHNRRDLQRIL